MRDWKTVRLGDVCEIVNGFAFDSKLFNTDKKGIPLIRIRDVIRGFSETYTTENADSRFLVKVGDLLIGMDGEFNCSLWKSEDSFLNQRVCKIVPNLELINKDYVYYGLKGKLKEIEDKTSFVTVKHISSKQIENIVLKYPPLETQQQIVVQLDKCTALIANQKQILEKYDTLIKSRFIEMFGNPQCISNNWKVNPLSDYCIVNPKKSELGPIPDDYELSFIPMQSVSENGDVDTSSIKHYKDVKTGFTYFKENDVLFAKITPCMENGKGGVARKLKNQIGFGSTEFHVLRPIETISNSEWIYRLTTFKTFRKDAENNMTGSAGQRRTPKEFFDKYKVGLPPIELQNDFAAFVHQIDKSKFEYTYTGVAA